MVSILNLLLLPLSSSHPTDDVAGKYFLMDDAYERASTIGFRCAYDLHTSAAFNNVPAPPHPPMPPPVMAMQSSPPALEQIALGTDGIEEAGMEAHGQTTSSPLLTATTNPPPS